MGIAVPCLGLVLLASAGAPPWDAVQAFHTGTNPIAGVVLRLYRNGQAALHALQHRRHDR